MKKTLLLILGLILAIGASAQGSGCTVTSFPYSETFDNWDATCWTQTGNTFSTGNQYYAHQGDCLGFGDSPSDYMLVLPPMGAPLNELTLTFWMRDNGWSMGSIQVGYCTDPTNTSTFVSLLTVRPPLWEEQWDEYTVDFTALEVTQGRIAFRHAAGSYASFYLDDLSVTRQTSCGNAVNLRVPTMGDHAAGVRWDNDGGFLTGDYWLQYKIVASQQWDSLNVTENYAFLTGLTEDTIYMVRIKSLCEGEGVYGAPVYFSTQGCGNALVGAVDSLNTSLRSEDLPLRTYANCSYSQQIYPASRLGRMTDTIYGIAFFSLMNISQDIDRDITIRLGLTEKERFEDEGDYIEDGRLRQVYSGTHRFSSYGWHTLMFDQPFVYDNRYNLVVAVNDHTGQGTGFWTPRFAVANLGTGSLYGNSTTAITSANLEALGMEQSDYVPVAHFLGPCRRSAGCGVPLVMEVGGDATSVDFAINPGGSEGSWDVLMRPLGQEDWEEMGNYGASPCTMGGLEPGTTYDFLFQPDCGQEGAFAAVVRATTECGEVSLPYRQNFDLFAEHTREILCWHRQGSSAVAQHPVQGRVYSMQPGDFVALPPVRSEEDVTLLNLRLLTLPTQAGSHLIVGLVDDPADLSTYEPIDTLTFATTAAAYRTVSFAEAQTTGRRVALVRPQGIGEGALMIDNVLLRRTPDCEEPAALTATATGPYSASLSFQSETGDYLIEWGPSGFEMGRGTLCAASASPATVQGLPSGTSLDFYVYAICSNGDTSFAAGPASATTECGAIVRPYRMDFEGIGAGLTDTSGTGLLPLCWSNAQGTSEVFRDYTTARRGTGCLALRPNGTVVLPPLADTLDARTTFVDFWAHCWEGTDVVVGLCDSADGTGFTPVETLHVENYVYVHGQRYLAQYTGTGRRVALRNSGQTVVYIDDLLLDNAPSCLPVSGLAQVGSGETTVTIDWTPLGQETQWEVFHTADGSYPTTGTLTTSHPYTLTGLTPTEEVEVYVRAVCGEGDTGRWTGPLPVAANTWTMRPNRHDDIYLCGGIVYDDGGAHGNYSDNQTSTLTVHADTAFGPAYLNIHVTGQVESSDFYTSDLLRLYDGVSAAGRLLYDGTLRDGALNISGTCYSGSLYVSFTADPFQAYSGFAIEVECEPVTCPMVSGLQASYADGAITASWTPQGEESIWDISYGPIRHQVVTTSYTFTDLLPSTCYPVSVRPVCSEGDTGRAQTVYVSTPCGPYRMTNRTPFFESFETEQVPVNSCWRVVYTPSDYNTPVHTIDQALHGERSFRFGSLDEVDPLDQYLVLPEMDCDDEMRLSFHARRSHESATERLAVGYSATSQNPTDASWVWTDTVQMTGSWTRYAFTLPAEAVYVGIRLANEASGYYVYLDSLLLTTASNGCGAPTLGEVSDLTFRSATLHWTGRAEATYELQMRPATASWSGAEQHTLQATEYGWDNLLAGTTYHYRLRTLCEEDVASLWVEGIFTTDSLPCHAPALALTDVQGTTASFSWGSGEHHTGYELRVWNTAFDTLVPFSGHEATVGRLFGGTAYQAAVRAECEQGAAMSDWSEPVEFTTLTCEAPTGLRAVAVTETSITFAWTDPAGASRWRVNYGPANHPLSNGTEVIVEENPCTIDGLQPGHSYDILLQALCADDWPSISVRSDSVTTAGESGVWSVESGEGFRLWPNPCAGDLSVESGEWNLGRELTIVDLQGRVVLVSTLNSQLSTLNLQGLPAGTYFVKVGNQISKLIVR